MRSIGNFSGLPILAFLVLLAWPIESAVYFVDFEQGCDTSDGLTQQSAWKHIPGTRTGSLWESSFVTTSFGNGAVVAGNRRLETGSVIRVKSGSVHNSSNGGAILINDAFYESGTAESPTVIQQDPQWGSGPVLVDAAGMNLLSSEAPLCVDRLDHIHIKGAQNPGGMLFTNSSQRGIALSGTASHPSMGLKLSRIAIQGMRSFGIDAKFLDSYEIEQVSIDGKGIAGNGGFHFGAGSCNNGLFSGCYASSLGDSPGAQRGGSDLHIGFWLVNAKNVTYRNCTAFNNEGDGFDVGLYKADGGNCTDSIRYIDCVSYRNADGFGMNAGEGLTYPMRIFCINSIAYENHHGGFHAYGGAAQYTYVHCLADGNVGGNFVLGPDGWTDQTNVIARIYNSIGYKPRGGGAFAGANMITAYIRDRDFRLESDYNFWRSSQEDGTGAFCFWDAYAGTNPYAHKYTYDNGPGIAGSDWVTLDENGHAQSDANSLSYFVGRPDPAFVNEAGRDYHLRGSSVLRGKGTDLRSKPWYMDEMGIDRDGKTRTTWDIGPFAATIDGPVSIAGTESAVGQLPRESLRPDQHTPAGALRGIQQPVKRIFSLDGRRVQEDGGTADAAAAKATKGASGAYIIQQRSGENRTTRSKAILR